MVEPACIVKPSVANIRRAQTFAHRCRKLAPMATASLATKKMPLPVELFNGAMERQLPLADYARNIDLHPDILGQALTGRLTGADSLPLSALAKAINRDFEQLDLTPPPCDESFGMWLKRNMEGITQHGLRARAQLDSQTLKRFLNGDLLPDSDQAERISRALYIDRLEIARVVTANMAAASPSIASQEPPEPKAMARRSKQSPESNTSAAAAQLVTGTRRRRASARHASAEPASSPSAVAPATSDEAAPATVAPDTTATAHSPVAGKRAKRASKPEARPPASTAAAMATHRPHDEHSSLTPPVPAQAVAEEGSMRRPKRSASRGHAAVAAAQQTPALTEGHMAVDDRPVEKLAAEGRSSPQASSRRRPRAIEASTTDISTSGDVPSAFAAEIARSKPDKRSADINVDRTAPLVTAELAADTTTLQLSADEVRLIRHWRQLHPHGRRATLQYIGSLLVDD